MDDRVKQPVPDTGPVVRERPQKHPAPPPEPEVAEPAPPPSPWPLKVKLGKPIEIKATDGSIQANITELEFREPTAEDIIKCGVPVTVIDYKTGEVKFVPEAMTAMFARLSGKPPYYFARMEAIDWINCATMLQNFFLPNFERLI